MNFSKNYSFLNSFVNFESKLHKISPHAFELGRVTKLLEALGHPQISFQSVHIAGTKGKGSTAAFVASILREAGFTVGIYTSPHLFSVNERIRILRPKQGAGAFEGAITDAEISSLIKKIKPKVRAVGKDNLTYFEVLTALAFCHFAQKKIDFAVLETGLGGRLDATNVVDSLVAAITPISFDHSAILGNTIAKITSEKAGIIKSLGQQVVIGPQTKAAMDVIRNRCAKFAITPLIVGRDIRYRRIAQRLGSQEIEIGPLKVKTSLIGAHQAENVATAAGVIESLRRLAVPIPNESIRRGIANARWPGRFEILKRKPLIIADGAHNVASAHAIVKTVREVLPRKKVVLLLGISHDKDIRGICRELNAIADVIVTTQSEHPRSHRFEIQEVRRLFPRKNCFVTRHIREGLRIAKENCKGKAAIIVTGSLFIVAESLRLYSGQVKKYVSI